MKKRYISGLAGIGICISVSLIIVLGNTISFNSIDSKINNSIDSKINYLTDPNINLNGPAEFQNGVINFIDSFDFGSELKNFNGTPLNELTDDYFSKSMVITHIESINNNNPNFTLQYNISYEFVSDLSVSFSKTINSIDNYFVFNDSTFYSPIYAKFRWWNENIVNIDENSAFSHVFSEVLLLNIYYYYDQHISCMSNIGYRILVILDLSCNPLLIVSKDIGHVPIWYEPSEHQLKYELYENLSTSVELNYNTYQFTLSENETHYYKILGISQTYLQIKFTGYPSGFASKIIFQGGWSSFSGSSTLRYSIRMVDDRWIYFYVYHRPGYENISLQYSVQLYTVPDTGQVSPTL